VPVHGGIEEPGGRRRHVDGDGLCSDAFFRNRLSAAPVSARAIRAGVPEDDQLVFYIWAVRDTWPNAKVVNASYIWFKERYFRQALIDDAMELRMRHRVWNMLDSVNKGKFEPVKGKHCSYCGFKRLCPLFGE